MSYVSHADLGGRPGHGAVTPEPEGELFHAAWEPRVLALTLAMGATGSWNIDISRSARETLPNYLALSYYAIWLEALQKLLLQTGLVQPDEIEQGRAIHPPRPLARVLQAGDVAAALAKGSPTVRGATTPARFSVGQLVRTRAADVPHHTRLPAYVRGKLGVVEKVLGVHVYADTNAQRLGEQPQWLYTVAFGEHELWGPRETPQGLTVSVDAWEPYLEPA